VRGLGRGTGLVSGLEICGDTAMVADRYRSAELQPTQGFKLRDQAIAVLDAIRVEDERMLRRGSDSASAQESNPLLAEDNDQEHDGDQGNNGPDGKVAAIVR